MGTNRIYRIFVLAGLAAAGVGAVGPTADATHYPGHFLVGSSIYDNLTRLINRPVKLLLRGGGEIRGTVREIGTKLVRLEGPSGEQSLVLMDEVAVLVSEAGSP
jgi:hypothetical protein